MIVSGSQQALAICTSVLVEPGSRVWVEDPGYMLLHSALKLAGCRLVPVPVDGEGMKSLSVSGSAGVQKQHG
ncbi:MAG: aminotransferase class I/II-fold pyridoxal phosphate-dependent enzyme [Acidobacteriaceae bacterium]|nr:aminotransferase class I/II-fold pyridoxal phosphate-dependent enzyme [Acidobacteriaceae bacterium]